ncbi:MAG: aldo/keto reductase [Halobacteriales archaeon]|nr:aldo/keto reductase [Halobacteriales archaeon]
MEYTTLTGTGMRVSRLCLGCQGIGLDTSEKYPWSVSEAESRSILERALELGINFYDTANSYSWGDSERVLGSVLAEHDRDWAVVATKVYYQMDDSDPNSGGLSRKTIEQQLAGSLDRLGMDTVDLYQIHRWDEPTPIAETLRALEDLRARGKLRYLGASSMWAYQLATTLATSDRLHLPRFATMQPHYNLVYREIERELLPLCAQESLGVIPWSPLAGGYLARPHDQLKATERGRTSDYLHARPYADGGGPEINERVDELAEEHGVTMAQLALAWLLHQPVVDAPIIGATSVEHLEEAVEALEVSLSGTELEYLEEPYQPVEVYGPQ